MRARRPGDLGSHGGPRLVDANHPDGGGGDREKRDRKAEHIRLALDARMQAGACWFDAFTFEHTALPELDLAKLDTRVDFLGRTLSAPLLISCMTGGTDEATRINRNLAEAAEATGIAVGVGSQRKAFEDPATEASFRIRPFAPSVPILANLGAVQLNYGFGVAECRRAVDMIDADALVLHLNPLQEAIQPEGQCNFAGLLDRIGEVVAKLPVPVIVKEVGCGLSLSVVRDLVARGVTIVDVAGQGGTSWARIEGARAGDGEIGELFAEWGIPTPLAIRDLGAVAGLTVIGSGGLRHGIDLAKALALGAALGGMAWQFLEAATASAATVGERLEKTIRELRTAMFCTGAATVDDLRRVRLRGPYGMQLGRSAG